ncbi:MAG: deoxyribonuclease IV [Anaerolineae bacterium]|nr:deoxyribonuclease IV [Anaerolineae bacterium]MCX8068085.1 deoxyribonuclease IV [Anaerolineae bacterium]
MRLGAHESISGGLHLAFDRAQSVGCDAVQLFVKSSRAWAVKPLTEEEIRLFQERAAATGIHPAVGHASYLLNPAAPDENLWRKSRDTLIVELERCEALGIPYLVLHPGSHMGAGDEEGLRRVARALGEAHAATRGFRVRILLETTAGQGTNLGYRFEQLAWLIENTPEGDRLGVCLDTCHLFAAGYDLRTPETYEETLAAFDRIIGLDRLCVVHFNDCKGPLGGRIDRHEHIGKGQLGLEPFRLFVNDPRFADLPGLLETPKSEDLHEDRENLAVLRSLVQA